MKNKSPASNGRALVFLHSCGNELRAMLPLFPPELPWRIKSGGDSSAVFEPTDAALDGVVTVVSERGEGVIGNRTSQPAEFSSSRAFLPIQLRWIKYQFIFNGREKMFRRRLQFACLVLTVGTLSVVWAQQNVPDPDELIVNEVKAHMKRYIGLANKENTGIIAKEIYETPILMIPFETPQHRLQDSATDFKRGFDEHLARLKKQDWKQFRIDKLDVHPVGRDLAFVDMKFVWLKTDGKPIGPDNRDASYVLAKKKNGWRIIAVMGNRKV